MDGCWFAAFLVPPGVSVLITLHHHWHHAVRTLRLRRGGAGILALAMRSIGCVCRVGSPIAPSTIAFMGHCNTLP